MKRFWKHVTAGVLLSGLAVSTACAHNDGSLFVRGVLAPPEDCLYVADPEKPFMFSGYLDVGVADQYRPVFLVGNQLVVRGDPTQVRAESSRILIQGAVIHVTDPGGGPPVPGGNPVSFTSLSTGFADPAQGSNATYGATAITIVDPATTAALRSEIKGRDTTRSLVAYVKVFGQTLGGQNMESNEFQFPFTVCNGCLVSFPLEAIDPTRQPAVNCFRGGTPATTACRAGQDQVTDCRQCSDRAVCLPPPP